MGWLPPSLAIDQKGLGHPAILLKECVVGLGWQVGCGWLWLHQPGRQAGGSGIGHAMPGSVQAKMDPFHGRFPDFVVLRKAVAIIRFVRSVIVILLSSEVPREEGPSEGQEVKTGWRKGGWGG